MSPGEPTSLPCPACGGRSDLASWLDAGLRAWRGERCVETRCPRCDGPAHLHLAKGEVAIGERLESGPVRFRPTQKRAQRGLDVAGRPDSLRVELPPRTWHFER